MTNEEKVIYLANVALISAVDGQVNPIEAEAIESVKHDIGATEPDLHKALNAVSQGNHKITPVGRFSDRVIMLPVDPSGRKSEDIMILNEKTIIFMKSNTLLRIS